MAKEPQRNILGESFFGLSADLPDVIEIELELLSPNPHQPRRIFDEDSIRQLADSIEENGLLSPINVIENPDVDRGYFLVAGERRARAHRLLGRQKIAAIRVEGDPAALALIENLQREDLHPMDSAQAIQKLMEQHGHTHENVSRVLGKSRIYITEILSLNSLPEQIRDECRTSDISKSVLIELARVKDQPTKLSLWEKAKTGKFRVKDLRESKKKDIDRTKKTVEEQAVVSAIILLRSLKKVSASDLTANEAQKHKLIDLQKQINSVIDGLLRGEDPVSEVDVQ